VYFWQRSRQWNSGQAIVALSGADDAGDPPCERVAAEVLCQLSVISVEKLLGHRSVEGCVQCGNA
jgi:hypothetical protein